MEKYHRHSDTLPLQRAALGALLSIGSPLGWMLLEWISGIPPGVAFADHPGVYIYMTIGTLIAFSLFGYLLGWNEQKLLHISIRDGLTSLYNARFFHERLPGAFALAKREKRPISLVQLDLDHFKQVNDQYGHHAGDLVLRQLGKVLLAATRQGETIARVGGEEFCIILDGADEHTAYRAAERFQDAVRSMHVPVGGGTMVQMTSSFGVACSTDVRADVWALHAAADAAMYKAKQDGRNCIRTHTAS